MYTASDNVEVMAVGGAVRQEVRCGYDSCY